MKLLILVITMIGLSRLSAAERKTVLILESQNLNSQSNLKTTGENYLKYIWEQGILTLEECNSKKVCDIFGQPIALADFKEALAELDNKEKRSEDSSVVKAGVCFLKERRCLKLNKEIEGKSGQFSFSGIILGGLEGYESLDKDFGFQETQENFRIDNNNLKNEVIYLLDSKDYYRVKKNHPIIRKESDKNSAGFIY